jgi:FAD/FMN-containing dehydrogenase
MSLTSAGSGGQGGDERALVNFGGNRRWVARRYRPRDEHEVLEILGRHRSQRVRAVGSLHSWSDIVVAPDVALDMSAFDEVEHYAKDGRTFARVGAGCRLQDILDRLHATTGSTLPTLGVIKRQTISGAVSTATHGSGRPGISHYISSVRIAAYDHAGEPAVFEYRGGDELKSARCALGCLGILLALEIETVPKYRIAETVRRFERVEDALQLCQEHPLTQFALVPHGWKIIAWERDALPGTGAAGLKTRFFRAFNFLGVDVLSHLLLKASILLGGPAVRGLLKALPYLLLANQQRIDDAEHVLTMRHDLFRHEEMEMFVPESSVAAAAAVARSALAIYAGDAASVPPEFEAKLRALGLYDELAAARGTYVHHYPMLFRRVLPEDTLISMASGSNEPWFSFSLFSFEAPEKRGTYYGVCDWFARAMHALFAARLHWGKHYPLGAAETAQMYPALERFRQIRRATDPAGVFRNDFIDRVIG